MNARRDPVNERAHLLFAPVLEDTVPARLAAVAEEVRVARLVAHLRPYLLSSPVCVTQPLVAVVPAQRRATHPAEQRLDDITAMTRARRARRASRPAPHGVPTVPYSGGTR